LAPGRGWRSVKRAIERRRDLARGALLWIEALAAIATVAIVVISLVDHFAAGGETFPGEGKRVVAFRQVTNRICTEHRGNLRRALAEARSRVERLGFVARALGWDLNDLESITPPPTKFDAFLAEVATRRRSRTEVLALQQAIELGDQSAQANAIAALEALESESRELSRESGVIRCTEVLPPMRELVQG
jgi:hypothetical protein